MADPAQIARDLVPLVEREAETSERIATMPEPVVTAFREAKLFALQVPSSLGGFEADFETALGVYETICRADASTGWSLLANASTSGFASTFCGDDAIAAMFGDGKLPTHAGQFSPRGTAVAADGGYVVSGSYSFGSGSAHAEWIGGGTLEMVDGAPRMLTPERPAIRAFFVPRDRVEFTGNWDVMGLVGTGSFDYTVPEQMVDASFTFDLIGDAPQRGAPMYRIGVLGLAAIGHAGFALGVGRRAPAVAAPRVPAARDRPADLGRAARRHFHRARALAARRAAAQRAHHRDLRGGGVLDPGAGPHALAPGARAGLRPQRRGAAGASQPRASPSPFR